VLQHERARGVDAPHQLLRARHVQCIPLSHHRDGAAWMNINRRDDLAAIQTQLGRPNVIDAPSS